MSDTKYTPGPWMWTGPFVADLKRGIYIVDSPGHIVANIAPIAPHAIHDEQECQANARLIASSPDLLSACKDVRQYVLGWREAVSLLEEFCHEPVRLKNMMAALDQIDSVTKTIYLAIAKAEGQ